MLTRKILAKSGRRKFNFFEARATKSAVGTLALAVGLTVAYQQNHHAPIGETLPKPWGREARAAGDVNPSTGKEKRKISIHATRGPRATMEDRWFVSDDMRFFAVYDGHGGHRVAELAQKHLYDEFMKHLEEASPGSETKDSENTEAEKKIVTDQPQIIKQAFVKSFDAVSRKVLSATYLDLEGSTAVVVYVSDSSIVAANLGDSRAILCRGPKAVALTKDHKPDALGERRRIEDLGGRVKWHGYLGPDKLPVPGMGAYRINGNLAVSRAFGDRLERPYVSSDPEIFTYERDMDEDRFIVLASDGLWDVMSSQDVVDFVRQVMAGSMFTPGSARQKVNKLTPSSYPGTESPSPSKGKYAIRSEMDKRQDNMAQFIVEEALRRGSADNVTVVVVWFW